MLDKINARLRSKTYWAAIVMAALSIVEANAQVLTAQVPTEYRVWLLMAWPLVMITLREVTTGALADK
jgi:uncharacterized integral membrane protein